MKRKIPVKKMYFWLNKPTCVVLWSFFQEFKILFALYDSENSEMELFKLFQNLKAFSRGKIRKS